MTYIKKHKLYFILPVLLLAISYLPVIDILNLSTYNQKFTIRGSVDPGPEVVIITIDNESIDWLSKWPWPRSYHAKLVDVLSKAGAKVIAFDVFFDSPTQFDPSDDEAFAESIRRAGNVIIGAGFQSLDKSSQFKTVGLPIKKPIPSIAKSALGIGIVHPEMDRDNYVRRFQMLYKDGDNLFPSFALQVIKAMQEDKSIKLIDNKIIKVGHKYIPQHKGKLLINYYGPGKTFKTIPYAQVHDESYIKDHPGFFKDKVVLIGATALELHDVFPSPTAKVFPGVEIHANIIQMILDNNYLGVLSPGFLFLFVVLLVIINLRLGEKLRMRSYFLATLGEGVFLYVFTAAVFIGLKVEIPTYTLLLAIFVTFVTVTIVNFIKEEKEKRKIRGVFSQYVAPSVVDEVLNNPDAIELGGTTKEVSIFFSDIRAFTTFSERHTPQEIVALLNEYLDAMTQVIFEYGGTLDKYVGDEIMAIFGAPLDLENHAVIGVKCAIAQMKKLRELQAKWKEEGNDILDIGLGLNTGTVVIGNIGSSMHKDYTVIGDAVNLAARLEAATRGYKGETTEFCYMLISEYTYNLVKDEIKCVFKDEIKVKGKNKPTRIYEVLIEENFDLV